MPALTDGRIADLLQPYLVGGLALPDDLIPRISQYLDLLLLWNGRTNLTSIRKPEMLVQRQIGESLYAASFVGSTSTLLDFGSGGGFPGIPLQIAMPGLQATLAESQGKKASFLREASRTLGLKADVWSGRVETMPADRLFDTVAMRAVDQSATMLPLALERVGMGGRLLRYLASSEGTEMAGWTLVAEDGIPLSPGRIACWARSA